MLNREKVFSSAELANGEHVGLGAIEIITVPHFSILEKRFTAGANIVTEYKQDISPPAFRGFSKL